MVSTGMKVGCVLGYGTIRDGTRRGSSLRAQGILAGERMIRGLHDLPCLAGYPARTRTQLERLVVRARTREHQYRTTALALFW